MGSEYRQLNIFFFPFPAHGHIIPIVDMAKLFASRDVKATIITTPLNASHISKTIGKAQAPGTGNSIHVQTIRFSSAEAGLPEGCENIDAISSPDMLPNFFKAIGLLQEPLEQLLEQHHPHCLIADMFFPWATDSANKFGIPRLVFHGTGFFSLCAFESMRLYEPHKNVSSDDETFLIPNFPGDMKMTRMQMPTFEDTNMIRFMKSVRESELKSYGVIVNSFYELEQVYADHYSKVHGRKAWHIGPLSLCNGDIEEKAARGKESAIDENECLKWLDSKETNSVVYVCFGSISNFTESQLKEIAVGLEASGQHFIWVVKRSKEDEEWLPEGFEKRMEGRGLIIRGWAPQVLILHHHAVGGFVTHCGWNSTLEGVSAGVPMVTWPVAAEQFYNEKLLTEVLKIGVPVGVKKWARMVGDYINWQAIERAVNRIMKGEEAEEMRNRAKELSQMARRAVEKGESSYSDLTAFIEELSSC
ncbi:hypothetical protein L6164_035694 [Bauhinia variegata]|uniref:Uncharacterized protein n=1 Tax=Bauhinia variegata TaxID=167791 RepID=A0ACB9KES8_BAUVA|nr:hypothetical protein L6164_035694 [Bauhinia variegata]